MSDFIERLKTDRMAQIIVAGLILMIIIFFYIFRGVFSPEKKSKLPCYQASLKIWLPFAESDVYPYFSEVSKYCLQYKIEKKSLDEIDRELPLSLASGDFPDIVYLDNDLLKKYEQILATPTPILVDTLIAYYNQDVLNFLNLEKPKTFAELKTFIQKLNNYRSDFYSVGLGTKEIRNRKEIILTLYSLNEDYKNKQRFINNFMKALDNYLQFSNLQSEFYSYSEGVGDDLNNFAQEKLALYIGFYQDKKEILENNPRLNFSIDYFPLNVFPPKAKIYTKAYYLVPVKKANLKASQFFIDWFYNRQLLNFSKDFDLVPFGNFQDLPTEKMIVLSSAKNFGETFDFLNKKILFDNLDRLLESKKDEREFNKIINEIYYSL